MVIFQSPTSWWTLGGVCSGKHWYAKIIIHTYIKLSYIYIICIFIYIYSWWANSSGDSQLSWFFRYGKIICELKSLFCCSTHPYIEFTVVFLEGPFPALFFFFKFLLSKDPWSFGVAVSRIPHRMRCETPTGSDAQGFSWRFTSLSLGSPRGKEMSSVLPGDWHPGEYFNP